MENQRDKIRSYYETLVQNAQKGASYYLKLKNDPVTYTAIPLIEATGAKRKEGMFIYRVLEPEEHKGTYDKPVPDIEMLERIE